MDDICFTCGAEGKVNSLGYCRNCMDQHIKDHHKEQKELSEAMEMEAIYGWNARV
jgi:hypothetical protein